MANANNIQIQLSLQGVGQAVQGLRQIAGAVAAVGAVGSQGAGAALGGLPGGIGSVLGLFTKLPPALAGAALAAGGLVVGATALAAAAVKASGDLMAFAQVMTALGGNARASNVLREFGSALGFNPIGLSNTLEGAANGGGLGTIAALRLGVGPQPLASALSGNPIDKAGRAAGFLGNLSDMIDREGKAAALAQLQLLGLDEQMGSFTELTKAQRQEFIRYAQERAKEFTPERIQKAAELQLRLQKLKDAFADLTFVVLDLLGPVIDFFIDRIKALTFVVLDLLGPAIDFFIDLIKAIPLAIAQIAGGFGFTGFAQKLAGAVERNTQALNNHGHKMDQWIANVNGIFGGGSRARSAIPRAFQGNGYVFDSTFGAEKMRWGAYTVAL